MAAFYSFLASFQACFIPFIENFKKMSSELIIIIIGAVLILVAVVDSIKISGTSLNLVDIKIKIPMAVLGIL